MQRKWRRVEETSIAASLTTLEPSSDEEDESDVEIVRNIDLLPSDEWTDSDSDSDWT